ncbi:MAG: carboxypeptidase-like regulatory domain-containing protein [Myxococcota bacterium]
MRLRSTLLIPLSLALSGVAFAQPAPAGPAEVITGAADGAEQARQQRNLGARRVPRSVSDRAAGRTPAIATAEADPSIPPGTIRVRVITPSGAPVPGADIRFGIMKSDGSRDSVMGRTGPNGVLDQRDLPTGSGQAYRVNVPYQGATYSSTPFRLEPNRGHRVEIRRLPVTRSQQTLIQSLGQTMLEYRNERVHITQQAQLINLGGETIVLADDSAAMELPHGFTAFQSQQAMSDQRIVPNDRGFVLRGSIPPGRTTLVWAYDIPLTGEEIHFSHEMPFRTYAYRVMSDQMTGMELQVDGFPEAEEHAGHQGRPLLVTQIERSPDDEPFRRLSVTVAGIPGPGPLRWLALGGAFVLLCFGFLLATRGGDRAGALARARAARQDELLDEASEVEELFHANDIGPQYRERRLREIVDELASLIRLNEATEASNAARSKRSSRS